MWLCDTALFQSSFEYFLLLSGTYNNQWMIVDFKLFKNASYELVNGVLTVLEQVPGNFHWEDQTEHMRQHGYWGSYNRAFYPESKRISGQNDMVAQYGDWFSHANTNR